MHIIRVGDSNSPLVLSIDIDAYLVKIGGKRVDLSLREYILLEKLFLSKEWLATKGTLLKAVFDEDDYDYAREMGLRTVVSRLRKKLASMSEGTNFIEAVNEVGYKLIPPILTLPTQEETRPALAA